MRFLIGAALAVLFTTPAFAQQSYTAADLAAANQGREYYSLGDFSAEAPPPASTRPTETPPARVVAPATTPPPAVTPVTTRPAPQRERSRLQTVAELERPAAVRGAPTDGGPIRRGPPPAPAPQSTEGWTRVNVSRAECQRRWGRPVFAGGYGQGYQYCLAPPGGLARRERTRAPQGYRPR